MIRKLRSKFRTGSLLSRLLRLVFEAKYIRAIFGANLAAGVLIVGSLGVPSELEANAGRSGLGNAEVVINSGNLEVTTQETGFQLPVDELYGVSTRYQLGHPGIDLRAPLGSPVRPISTGKVKMIVHSEVGYGRRVVVEHDKDVVSMYAHMGKIMVDEGEEVELTTQLGEVGLTGWTTGPHVHLEIHQSGVSVNPALYLVFD